MTTEDMIEYAEKNGIEIYFFHICGNALTIDLNGSYYIALNPDLKEPELKEVLTHELCHCFTRGFYSIHSQHEMRECIEASAEHWAYKMLLPPEKAQELISKGIAYNCDIASEMDLTERFTHDAMEYYLSRSMI